MTDIPLHRLLVKAGIADSAYWRALWFTGCRLERNLLLCPDRDAAEMIDRLFLPQLRGVLTDLQIRIHATPRKSMPSAWRAPAATPTRAVYTGSAREPEPGDLL